jgi:SlyX protein
MEQRIVELELKAAEQQHELEELSGVVYKQQRELDALKAALQSLAKRVGEPGLIDDKPPERPPHY